MYREVIKTDYFDISNHINLNNQREVGIWCKSSQTMTPELVEQNVASIGLIGTLFTQVNEIDNKVASFYAGYEYKQNIVYVIGIVDPGLQNYMEIWKKDAAILFDNSIKRGNKIIHIKLSSVNVELVPWLDNEVKAKKHPDYFVWTISSDEIKPYIDKYI